MWDGELHEWNMEFIIMNACNVFQIFLGLPFRYQLMPKSVICLKSSHYIDKYVTLLLTSESLSVLGELFKHLLQTLISHYVKLKNTRAAYCIFHYTWYGRGVTVNLEFRLRVVTLIHGTNSNIYISELCLLMYLYEEQLKSSTRSTFLLR